LNGVEISLRLDQEAFDVVEQLESGESGIELYDGEEVEELEPPTSCSTSLGLFISTLDGFMLGKEREMLVFLSEPSLRLLKEGV